MEYIYKAYFIWDGEKIYLKNRGRTDIFSSLKGVKLSIGKDNMFCYIIEKYKVEFCGEVKYDVKSTD